MITIKDLMEKLITNNYDQSILSDEELKLYNRLDILGTHDGKLVKHFEGKLYLIIGSARHTEMDEVLVIYKAMYDDYKIHAKPIDMFLSKVDKDKHPDVEQEYVFDFINLK